MLTDLALLILRVTIGLLFAAHGAQKLFGWFGGKGLKKWAATLQQLGMAPGGFWAAINALAEFLGGLLLILGVLTPVACAALISTMIVAIVKVHWTKGLWNRDGGYEFPLTLLVTALTIGLSGPGAYTLNPQFFARLPQLLLFGISLLVGLLGVAISLIISQRQLRHRQQTM